MTSRKLRASASEPGSEAEFRQVRFNAPVERVMRAQRVVPRGPEGVGPRFESVLTIVRAVARGSGRPAPSRCVLGTAILPMPQEAFERKRYAIRRNWRFLPSVVSPAT